MSETKKKRPAPGPPVHPSVRIYGDQINDKKSGFDVIRGGIEVPLEKIDKLNKDQQ